MQIVIDIPEEEYELIVGDEACGLNPLTRAVAHGIPLDNVLAKIKAEIITKYENCLICEYDSDYGGRFYDIGDVADIFQIIDEYKVKSERSDKE